MENIIISSFTIGFIAAALPGAVQTTILQSSIIGKAKSSLKFALGASTMDGLYLGLAYFGLVQILISYHWLKVIIGILGSLYIGYIGIVGLRDSLKNTDAKEIRNKSFFSGFVLVLLHIPTLLYFVSVAGTFFKNGVDLLTVILSCIALSFGAMACFIFVSLIGKMINKFGSRWLVKTFNILASLILIFFALKVIWQLF
ncbi:MAG: LysE family transporter [Candidatus Magasanikbacteria bacterium]